MQIHGNAFKKTKKDRLCASHRIIPLKCAHADTKKVVTVGQHISASSCITNSFQCGLCNPLLGPVQTSNPFPPLVGLGTNCKWGSSGPLFPDLKSSAAPAMFEIPDKT